MSKNLVLIHTRLQNSRLSAGQEKERVTNCLTIAPWTHLLQLSSACSSTQASTGCVPYDIPTWPSLQFCPLFSGVALYSLGFNAVRQKINLTLTYYGLFLRFTHISSRKHLLPSRSITQRRWPVAWTGYKYITELTRKLRKVGSGWQLNPLLPSGGVGTHPIGRYSFVPLAGLNEDLVHSLWPSTYEWC